MSKSAHISLAGRHEWGKSADRPGQPDSFFQNKDLLDF